MTSLELDRIAFQYLDALDAGDLDAIARLYALAETDADVADLLDDLAYRVVCEAAGMDEIDETEGLQ